MDSLIIEFLKDKIPFLACIAVLIALSLCALIVGYIRNRIKELAVQRKCKVQICVTAIFILVILLLLYFSNEINIWIVIGISAAILAILFVIWWFTFHLTPITYFYIKKYLKLYKHGYVFEKLERIRKKPFYIFTVTDKLQFAIIQYRYFILATDYKSAYDVLSKMSELNLLDKERAGINSRILFTLYNLGAFSADKTS